MFLTNHHSKNNSIDKMSRRFSIWMNNWKTDHEIRVMCGCRCQRKIINIFWFVLRRNRKCDPSFIRHKKYDTRLVHHFGLRSLISMHRTGWKTKGLISHERILTELAVDWTTPGLARFLFFQSTARFSTTGGCVFHNPHTRSGSSRVASPLTAGPRLPLAQLTILLTAELNAFIGREVGIYAACLSRCELVVRSFRQPACKAKKDALSYIMYRTFKNIHVFVEGRKFLR